MGVAIRFASRALESLLAGRGLAVRTVTARAGRGAASAGGTAGRAAASPGARALPSAVTPGRLPGRPALSAPGAQHGRRGPGTCRRCRRGRARPGVIVSRVGPGPRRVIVHGVRVCVHCIGDAIHVRLDFCGHVSLP